jgi:hypothetical protein
VRARALLGLAAFATVAVPAHAGSITQARPHDPARAKAEVEKFVKIVDRGDYEAYSRRPGTVLVFTDDQGFVLGEDEKRAFLEAMNGVDGHPDRAPIRVRRMRLLSPDPYGPVYVVELERERWFPRREEELNGLMPEEEAGYRSASETWLAGFLSDDLFTFRKVDELWRLTLERD